MNSLSLHRRGIEPCRRNRNIDNKKVGQDYENPKVARNDAKTEHDVNDQYMELEDPKLAGYENQSANY